MTENPKPQELPKDECLQIAINLIATAKEKLINNAEFQKNLAEAIFSAKNSNTTIDELINRRGIKLTIDNVPYRLLFISGEEENQNSIVIKEDTGIPYYEHPAAYAAYVGYKIFPDKTIREPIWGTIVGNASKKESTSNNQQVVEEFRNILRKI